MGSFSTSFGIPLGQMLSIVIDCPLLEEIDLRTKLEIHLHIEREAEVTISRKESDKQFYSDVILQ